MPAADHPRRHQAVQGLLALGGSLLLRLLHAPRAAQVAAIFGVVGLLLAAVAPESWLRAIRRALDAFAHGVGGVVSTIVLSLVYFGFMLPAGLFSRRKKDARYHGGIERRATTYWTPARPSESSERQF